MNETQRFIEGMRRINAIIEACKKTEDALEEGVKHSRRLSAGGYGLICPLAYQDCGGTKDRDTLEKTCSCNYKGADCYQIRKFLLTFKSKFN